MVLDEPTNDLDIESLELLEQKLQDYTGTLLLVSHDRRFLDNVVTQTLAAEGGGQWHEYVGGYTDWLRQRRRLTDRRAPARQAAAQHSQRRRRMRGRRPSRPPGHRRKAPKTKLSYKDQRELAALPDEIEALEREQSELNTLMSSPDYHRRGPDKMREDRLRSEQIEALLLTKFERWEQPGASQPPASAADQSQE